MGKHELEQVELTNMCAIIDEKNQKVVVQKRIKSWKGISFPGGHVEKGEALVPSTIREIKEETGLDICHLKFCGVKDWFEVEKNKRYMVFLFATTEFSGELIGKTDEGAVYWETIQRLPELDLSSGFIEMAEMMLKQSFAEFWYEINDDDWIKKFY
ncbi:8-oxo-dGTP diphosphatase [Lactococcus protaetiae]|uniref:8-oxo-dGTP diphosphatase n=1 Tax=Lactococcus protaetiae TaxID=2592653 RepID=A0A514ZBJ5_9LACT|nr:8-oxo-dGTP diphosphatase [Lactococcus protaetiae]MCL2113331.1 8-oxo-dGTP diphosphatase [Streptococcaceae bacterium]QDK71966.1 8-oxo-dGTP diphosphatase [Lactococcus protaetiae]